MSLRLGTYLLAVAVAYLLATLAATQAVVARLAGMGVRVPFDDRLAMSLRDIAGMAPMFLPMVAFALLVAFLAAALLCRWPVRLPLQWRVPLYALAGAAALVTIHLVLHLAFGLTPVAIARTPQGLLLQGIAGACGGLAYVLLVRRQASAIDEAPEPISIFTTVAETARACLALAAITVNTIVLTLVICVLAIPKWLLPGEAVRGYFRRILAHIAEAWISINNFILSRYRNTDWDLEIPTGLDHNGCYLVSCNHRSWVDILVLQRCFNRRLPFMRFFLKRELIRVPFLGMAWWALDFPFMRRDAKSAGSGRDLESARKACEKFRKIPVAIMNFPEGTRFSEDKRDKGKAPFRNLLLPRIGGMGQVLYALGEQLDALIDVTIVYPSADPAAPAPTFWALLTGRVPKIVARAERREIPPHLLGRDFRGDPQFRRGLEDWMNRLWQDKDELITQLQR